MKTKTYFFLSILMIFATISLGLSEPNLNPPASPAPTYITYKVSVKLVNNVALCGKYLVSLKKGTGQLAAAPQQYNPQVEEYYFTERGPASGARIATLTVDPTDAIVCNTTIKAVPSVIYGPFNAGITYSLFLYPTLQGLPH